VGEEFNNTLSLSPLNAGKDILAAKLPWTTVIRGSRRYRAKHPAAPTGCQEEAFSQAAPLLDDKTIDVIRPEWLVFP
jgi:hypothetical protein